MLSKQIEATRLFFSLNFFVSLFDCLVCDTIRRNQTLPAQTRNQTNLPVERSIVELSPLYRFLATRFRERTLQ